MILKIDHIAYGSANFEHDLLRFAALGCRAQFTERGLEDLENKRDFMHQFSGELDMALLRCPGCVAIELLNHGHTIQAPSYVLPVLNDAGSGKPLGESFQVGGRVFTKMGNESEEFFIEQRTDQTGLGCPTVIADSIDLAGSIGFWNRLGFKTLIADAWYAHLEFKPFLGGENAHMFVRSRNGNFQRCWLDGRGFNCLAFFSSDAHKDRKQFERVGMRPSEPNPLRVNGKKLTIFWVHGPAGEVAEVIGLAGKED